MKYYYEQGNMESIRKVAAAFAMAVGTTFHEVERAMQQLATATKYTANNAEELRKIAIQINAQQAPIFPKPDRIPIPKKYSRNRHRK